MMMRKLPTKIDGKPHIWLDGRGPRRWRWQCAILRLDRDGFWEAVGHVGYGPSPATAYAEWVGGGWRKRGCGGKGGATQHEIV